MPELLCTVYERTFRFDDPMKRVIVDSMIDRAMNQYCFYRMFLRDFSNELPYGFLADFSVAMLDLAEQHKIGVPVTPVMEQPP